MTDALDRRAGTTERLDRIWEDLTGLRTELAASTKAQGAINAEFRDHLVRTEALGKTHEQTYEAVHADQVRQEARLRKLEDAHIEIVTTTRTVMRVVQLTLGASVLGIILMVLNLVDLASRAAGQ